MASSTTTHQEQGQLSPAPTLIIYKPLITTGGGSFPVAEPPPTPPFPWPSRSQLQPSRALPPSTEAGPPSRAAAATWRRCPWQCELGWVRCSRSTMGNVNEGKGLFAPLVVLARNIVGKKRFNQLRGKAVALHLQVITEFCKAIGADAQQRQALIRLTKKKVERLGFLA